MVQKLDVNSLRVKSKLIFNWKKPPLFIGFAKVNPKIGIPYGSIPKWGFHLNPKKGLPDQSQKGAP